MLRCGAGGATACVRAVRAFSRRVAGRLHDDSPHLLVVQPKGPDAEAHLREALRLVATLPGGQAAAHQLVQRVRSGDAATYFGSGTVQAVADHLAASGAAGEHTTVVINARLTGVQERNLSDKWGVRVLDRVGLIVGVFAARAVSAEAALQVELAKLSHEASRLVRSRATGGFGADGRTSVVSARQRGGNMSIGGEGESELALQRRRIIARRAQLVAQLATVERTRALHRARRAPSGHSLVRDVPQCGPHLAYCAAPPAADSPPTRVALVGYTNAGKSTLAGALAGSSRGFKGRDMLFATLDTTTRAVQLPSQRRMLLSDSVGFVRELPTALVAAFRSTLAEAAEADVLLHVLDASLPPRESAAQRAAVHDTLRALGFSEGRLRHGLIEVYNKADELEAGKTWQRPRDASWLALPVSAATGEGIPLLRHVIDAAAQLAACHGAPPELRTRDERERDAAALDAAEALT